MRRLLGTLLATVVLGTTAACGSSSSSIATDPASDPAGNPSRTPGPIEGAHVLPPISMTGIGGRAARTATPLNTPGEIARFLRQFPAPATQKRLRGAILAAPHPPGHDVVGQVVAIGCDRPPGVSAVVSKEGAVELVPGEVASPLQECLAAVTTVAIAVVPSSLAPARLTHVVPDDG
jgi:hypothetical protein